LQVAVYPIKGDGEEITAYYIDWLSDLTFRPIEEFIATEAGAYLFTGDRSRPSSVATRSPSFVRFVSFVVSPFSVFAPWRLCVNDSRPLALPGSEAGIHPRTSVIFPTVTLRFCVK